MGKIGGKTYHPTSFHPLVIIRRMGQILLNLTHSPDIQEIFRFCTFCFLIQWKTKSILKYVKYVNVFLVILSKENSKINTVLRVLPSLFFS